MAQILIFMQTESDLSMTDTGCLETNLDSLLRTQLPDSRQARSEMLKTGAHLASCISQVRQSEARLDPNNTDLLDLRDLINRIHIKSFRLLEKDRLPSSPTWFMINLASTRT